MKKVQRIIKRVLDGLLAGVAIVCLSPVMAVAAAGIRLTSKGPLIYKATRMGVGLKPFRVYKFRTMHIGADRAGAITGADDPRIFRWGQILRKTKVDELPQLFNILNGTMSVIGPRPEDTDIVENHYTDEEKRTLSVLPGLACPGSIYNYTHGERYLTGENAEEIYVTKLLHVKLGGVKADVKGERRVFGGNACTCPVSAYLRPAVGKNRAFVFEIAAQIFGDEEPRNNRPDCKNGYAEKHKNEQGDKDDRKSMHIYSPFQSFYGIIL